VPLDSDSSYKRGAASAPAIIRDALYCDSSNLWTEDLTEDLIDLGALSRWHIKEDVQFEHESSPFEQIENEIDTLLKRFKSYFVRWRPFYYVSCHLRFCELISKA